MVLQWGEFWGSWAFVDCCKEVGKKVWRGFYLFSECSGDSLTALKLERLFLWLAPLAVAIGSVRWIIWIFNLQAKSGPMYANSFRYFEDKY